MCIYILYDSPLDNHPLRRGVGPGCVWSCGVSISSISARGVQVICNLVPFMALSDMVSGIGTGTSYNKVDIEDSVMAPVFTVSTASAVGVASVSLFGRSLTDVATTLGGFSISWAFIISIAALGFAYLTNNPDMSDMSDEYTLLAATGAALLVLVEFSPTVSSAFEGSTVLSLGGLAVASGLYYTVSYLG